MRGGWIGWLGTLFLASAGAAEQQKLVIYLFDYARVPHFALEETADGAGRILGHAGIETDWHICIQPANRGACAMDQENRFPIVRIIAKGAKSLPHIFGVAIKGLDGLSGVYATVFYDRVADTSRRYGSDTPVLLSCAVAHELGELLGLEHAPEGVMRAAFDQADVERAARGRLRFTAEQALHLRKVVLARLARGRKPAAAVLE